MSPIDPGVITSLLHRMRSGQQLAKDELFRIVYDDLRAMARGLLYSGGFGRLGLDGTAVVNAACARLLGRDALDANDRGHFYFLLSRAMQDVLVEEARSVMAVKRGGGRQRVELSDAAAAREDSGMEVATWDVVDLHDALNEFRAKDPAAAQVVELRFFAGRTLDETAELMGTTLAIVRRDWSYAKAWLGERLGREAGEAN